MCFWNYRLSKTLLDLSLRSAVSEHPSRLNMLKGPKLLWNLHESTFNIFIHHSEGKWFGKYVSYWSLKWEACLLTHGLPITSILFRIVVISRSLFKFKYRKTEKYFVSFLFHLWNLHQILNIFKKKDDRHSWCIFQITDCQRLGYTTHYKVLFQNILRQSTC